LAQIWSHSPDVSFIYPLGEEHGFDLIERHVFEKVMGGMFSARDLKMHDVAIYVNGNSAWSEFRWDFHAMLRKDGSAVTTHGVETQIYRKEEGKWPSRACALFRGSRANPMRDRKRTQEMRWRQDTGSTRHTPLP
jgi:hypothetical protein